MLTAELVHYRNVNIRGVVNNTTAHAEKCDIRMTSVFLYRQIALFSCTVSALFEAHQWHYM